MIKKSSLPLIAFVFSRLAGGFLLLAAAGGLAAAAVEPVPACTVEEIKEISPREEAYFHGWPTVTRLHNGTLVAAYSGGRDAHSCPFGRVEVMFSLNEGRTWSWPRVVLDTAIDDRDAGLLETAKGTLLLTSFNSIGFEKPDRLPRYAKDPARWERYAQGLPATDWAEDQGPMILRSEDGGKNWSLPARIPVSSPHGPIQLADGRLLYPGIEGVGKGSYYKPGERKAGVWESLDDGLTWHLLAQLPTRPGDDAGQYHELHGIEAADGTIIVLIRSHSGQSSDVASRIMLQTESKDGGKTWSTPRSLGINGYPPHLLRLRDDRLLMSYDRRNPPYGVAARISSDNGVTWSGPIQITSLEKKRDQGYPSTVELKDGSFLTIWYEVVPELPRAIIRQAKWSLR